MPQQARMGGLDVWRSILPVMGVVYHCAALAMAKGASGYLAYVVVGVHSFRMEAFFAIAGLLAGRKIFESSYIFPRLRTLLVPVFTLWLLMTAINPGRGTSLLTGSLAHLWFLICLAEMTVFTVYCHRFGLLRMAYGRIDVSKIVIVSIPILYLSRILFTYVSSHRGEELHLAGTLFLSAYYIPYFLFGIVVARNDAVKQLIIKNRWLWLAGPFAVLLTLLMGVALDRSNTMDGSTSVLEDLALVCCSIGMTVTVIGISVGIRHSVNKNFYHFATAGYTIYLLHYPIVHNSFKLTNSFDIYTQFIFAIALSTTIPLVIHWLMQRSPILQMMLNGASLKWKTPQLLSNVRHWTWTTKSASRSGS